MDTRRRPAAKECRRGELPFHFFVSHFCPDVGLSHGFDLNRGLGRICLNFRSLHAFYVVQ